MQFSSVQFNAVPWLLGSTGAYDGRFSTLSDSLPVFSAAEAIVSSSGMNGDAALCTVRKTESGVGVGDGGP